MSLRRLPPYLIVALVALASLVGLVTGPVTGTSQARAAYVVIAGAAGLRWDDVNATDTPTLWRLAEHGSIGALSVRSAHEPTCPADGWLTLGAGNYALYSARAVPALCPATAVRIDRPDDLGARLPDMDPSQGGQVVQIQPDGVQLGALAESVRCTVAIGTGATLAAARPYGRVDRYQPNLPAARDALLSQCVLSIVDLGTITGTDPVARAAQARAVDDRLAALMAQRPAGSLLLVAGLSDTDQTSRLHVAIADGPGYSGGWLSSSSTSRPGYVQLVDLAPTALSALNKPLPTKLFAGAPIDTEGGRSKDLATAVGSLADADREAGAQRAVTGGFYALFALVQVLLFAAAVPVLRRARPVRGSTRRAVPPRLLATFEVLLIAASCTIPAAFLADAVPWWRIPQPGLLFSVVTLVVVAALTAGALLGPARRGALGLLSYVGAIAAAVVGLDVLTGSRLQLNGVAGYSALEGRYTGIGTSGLGALIAGTLLVAGSLAQHAPRAWRPAVVGLGGAVGVVLVGSPYLGADAGGALALTAGACVAAAICTGGWLTFPRLAWATLAGLVVSVGFALLDLRRPAPDQGSLGHLVAQARNRSVGQVVHAIGTSDGVALLNSPLTVVVLAATVLIIFALNRPWGGLKRLFGLFPAIRGALIGAAVAALLAGLVDGAGLTVAGAAVATAGPVTILAALRVLGHADDRTSAARPPDAEAGAAGRPDSAADAQIGATASAGADQAGDG